MLKFFRVRFCKKLRTECACDIYARPAAVFPAAETVRISKCRRRAYTVYVGVFTARLPAAFQKFPAILLCHNVIW